MLIGVHRIIYTRIGEGRYNIYYKNLKILKNFRSKLFDKSCIIYTCIIWALHYSSARITTQLLILSISGETYSLKLTTNDRFLRHFSFSLRVFSQISAKKHLPKIYFLIFPLVRDVAPNITQQAMPASTEIRSKY